MSGFANLEIDAAIVRRACRQEPKALAMVFQCFAPAVYTLAYRLSQSRAQADDLTQETFVAVMEALPQFRGDASLATWIRRIAVSRCLMHLRSAWQRKSSSIDSLPEVGAETAGPGRRAALCSDLEAALATLSITARTVVWLYDVEGYSHQEIADQMGKSVSFSKSCLSRAHQQLRLALDGDDEQAAADERQPATEAAGRILI